MPDQWLEIRLNKDEKEVILARVMLPIRAGTELTAFFDPENLVVTLEVEDDHH